MEQRDAGFQAQVAQLRAGRWADAYEWSRRHGATREEADELMTLMDARSHGRLLAESVCVNVIVSLPEVIGAQWGIPQKQPKVFVFH